MKINFSVGVHSVKEPSMIISQLAKCKLLDFLIQITFIHMMLHNGLSVFVSFFKGARAGEQTRDLLISFIFSFHHFTAEPQRLPKCICFLLAISFEQSRAQFFR
jgi:hypothetical protein